MRILKINNSVIIYIWINIKLIMKTTIICITILILFSFFIAKNLKTKQACVRHDLTVLSW
jgi:hypothetical protein